MTKRRCAGQSTHAPSTVTLSASAVAANTARMAQVAQVPVMAVVKGDGFALGAAAMARAARAGGARELGVATCDEALALRAAGVDASVMAWLLHPGAPIDEALAADVVLSCASVEQLTQVVEAASRAGRVAQIELEVETGMHRSGAEPAAWSGLFQATARAVAAGHVTLRGIWTHLGGRIDDETVFDDPLAELRRAHGLARVIGLAPVRAHAASSLAAVVAPAARGDIVRLGASLLGIEPLPARPVGLTPAVRWHTRVVQRHPISAGERIGYGGEHRAPGDGTLALLPVGYADGLPRAAYPGAEVSVRGRRVPIVGAVSMDQCVIEVPEDVKVGDEVVIIGDRPGEPTLAQWAADSGTIEQEVLARLGPRVARACEQEER